LDVFPQEPSAPGQAFRSELAGLDNVLLTPHIGGSTEEARHNMALEVAAALQKYINTGGTIGAVNFPEIDLRPDDASHRILNIHQNIPGVLSDINRIVSAVG